MIHKKNAAHTAAFNNSYIRPTNWIDNREQPIDFGELLLNNFFDYKQQQVMRAKRNYRFIGYINSNGISDDSKNQMTIQKFRMTTRGIKMTARKTKWPFKKPEGDSNVQDDNSRD